MSLKDKILINQAGFIKLLKQLIRWKQINILIYLLISFQSTVLEIIISNDFHKCIEFNFEPIVIFWLPNKKIKSYLNHSLLTL